MNKFLEKLLYLPFEIASFFIKNAIKIMMTALLCSVAYTLAPTKTQVKVDKKVEVVVKKLEPLSVPVVNLGRQMGVLEPEKTFKEKIIEGQKENFTSLFTSLFEWIGKKLDKVVNDIITGAVIVIIAFLVYKTYLFKFPSPVIHGMN